MRALLLRSPPPLAAESLPPCFATKVDEPSLREWLAHPGAHRALTAVPAGAKISDLLSMVVPAGAESHDGIFVLYVPAHTVLSREDAATLDLEGAFERTAADADETIERLIDEAETLFDRDDWEGSERIFRRAEARLSEETSVRRAEVLAGLGEISRLQGRAAEATALLDRALSMSPTHPVALRGRATLARTQNEHATAAALLERLAAVEEDSGERSDLLSTVAAESLEAARQAIKAALELRPRDIGLLERLRAAHEAAGRWNDVVTVSVELAEMMTDRKMRAHALAAAADLCVTRAKNPARAVALYEAAITDDPQVPGAFEAIEATLIEAGDPAGVASAYERQLERLEGTDAAAERASLLQRLAVVLRDQMRNPEAAIHVLERIATEEPGNIGARLDLAQLLHSVGQSARAVRCMEVAAQHEPLAPPVHRRLLHLFGEIGDGDRAFAASAALVALGEADSEEQMLYAEHAPQSPLTFSRTFDDDVWEQLLPDPRAADIEAVFSAIEEPCIDAWIARHEAQGSLPVPPADRRQDPATSTVAAVRTFAWASRLLGVPEPSLYAAPENARVSTATLPGRSAVVLLGRPVLTGRSPVELVFIATRHMAYLRPGRRVLAYYPSPVDLEPLLRAAVAVLRPDLVPATSLPPFALDIGQRLERALDPGRRARLAEALGKLWSQGGVVDLSGWTRTVEAAACRAALLATGDVAVARLLLSVSGGPVAGLSAADRVRDLLSFSVTQRYAALRRLLGVQVTERAHSSG